MADRLSPTQKNHEKPLTCFDLCKDDQKSSTTVQCKLLHDPWWLWPAVQAVEWLYFLDIYNIMITQSSNNPANDGWLACLKVRRFLETKTSLAFDLSHWHTPHLLLLDRALRSGDANRCLTLLTAPGWWGEGDVHDQFLWYQINVHLFESSTVPCFVSSCFFVDLLSSTENTTYVQICFFFPFVRFWTHVLLFARV